MSEFKIEKNVPLPGVAATYPFEQMEVGDSFFAEGKTANQLQNAASHWRKRKGWKFATRTEEGGARIWRTE